MGHFYTAMAAGDSDAEALAKAQRALLKGTDARLQHPAYWAGFLLMAGI